jgi:hypothetical protein
MGRVKVHDQEQLAEVCKEVLLYIENDLTKEDLTQMGLEREVVAGENFVLVKLSGRRIFSIDIEHMMCKVYLAAAAYRGSRSFSVPSPWRPHCHPTPSTDIFCDQGIKDIFAEAISSFSGAYEKGTLDSLSEPFLFKHEKHRTL